MTDYYKKYLKYRKKYLKLNGGMKLEAHDNCSTLCINSAEEEQLKNELAILIENKLKKELNYEIKSDDCHKPKLSEDCIILVDDSDFDFDDSFLNMKTDIDDDNVDLAQNLIGKNLFTQHPITELIQRDYKFYVNLAGGTTLKLICADMLMNSNLIHEDLNLNLKSLKIEFNTWYKDKLVYMSVWNMMSGGSYDPYLKNIKDDAELTATLNKTLIDIIKEQIKNLSDIDLKIHLKLSPEQLNQILPKDKKVDNTTLINIILARIKIGDVTTKDLSQNTGKYGEQLDIGLPVITQDFLSKLSHSNLNDLDKIIYEMIYIVAKDKEAKDPKRLSRLQRLIILFYFEKSYLKEKSTFSIKNFLNQIIQNKTYKISNLHREVGGQVGGAESRPKRRTKRPDFFRPEEIIGKQKQLLIKKKKNNDKIILSEKRQIQTIIQSLIDKKFLNSSIGRTTIDLITFIYLDEAEEYDEYMDDITDEVFNCPLFSLDKLKEYKELQILTLRSLLNIYDSLELYNEKKKIPHGLFSEIWNLADDKQIAKIIKYIPDGVTQVKCIILLSIQKLITKTLTELIASISPTTTDRTDGLVFQNWANIVYNLVYDDKNKSIQNIVDTNINIKINDKMTKIQTEKKEQAFIDLVNNICSPEHIHQVKEADSGINIINEAMKTIFQIDQIQVWAHELSKYLKQNGFNVSDFTFWSNKSIQDWWDRVPNDYSPVRVQVSHLHVTKK